MTNFSDQLFSDLMREHGSTLREAQLPAAGRRHHLRRGAWLAGGAGTLAVGITASLAAFGGTASEAYAITPHSDGTVTVALMKPSGVTGANAALRNLGLRAVLVPVKDGCPSITSLPAPPINPGEVDIGYITMPAGSKDGSITFSGKGIPAGELLMIAVATTGGATTGFFALVTTPPAPACVSMPGPGSPGGRGGTKVSPTDSGASPGSSTLAG